MVAQRSQSLPMGGLVRDFDGDFDEQRFWSADDVVLVVAETYLLFDGFDVAVRDWRYHSSHPKRPNSQSRTARSWRSLRQERPGRARDVGAVKYERGREPSDEDDASILD